jgi:hypothetical protein
MGLGYVVPFSLHDNRPAAAEATSSRPLQGKAADQAHHAANQAGQRAADQRDAPGPGDLESFRPCYFRLRMHYPAEGSPSGRYCQGIAR